MKPEGAMAFKYQDMTVLNPLAFGLTLLMGLLVLYGRRDKALFALIVVASIITNTQRIVVAGADFDMLRIMIIFGVLRVSMRGEWRFMRWNSTDRLFLAWITVRTLAYMLMMRSLGGTIYSLGYAYTGLGLYLVFRALVRDPSDIRAAIRAFVLVSVPVALAMLNEQLTGLNVFSIFGGVPAFTAIREGMLRAQGAFSHPILAGSYGAALLPLMWGLAAQRGADKFLALIGAAASVAITLASASSGPIMGLVGGIGGIWLWVWRRYARQLVVTGVAGVAALDMVMKAPVYALVFKINPVGAGKGYHRYRLIDAFVRRFDEWVLVGVPSTAHWGRGMYDITNRYVREGVDGGILSLLLFVAVLVSALRATVHVALTREIPRRERILAWAVGASLLSHMVSFLGVSYFGQMMFFLYLPVAMLAALHGWLPEKVAELRLQEEAADAR
jgi:hypothetical protein